MCSAPKPPKQTGPHLVPPTQMVKALASPFGDAAPAGLDALRIGAPAAAPRAASPVAPAPTAVPALAGVVRPDKLTLGKAR